MIVFQYTLTKTVEDCHLILNGMNIPGESTHEPLGSSEEGDSIVWKGDAFIAIHYPEEAKMELYATKNTNSANYFIRRYPGLDWDTWAKIDTKRW